MPVVRPPYYASTRVPPTRRNAIPPTPVRSRKRTPRGGCGSIIGGLILVGIMAIIVTGVLADRFFQSTERMTRDDPRHAAAQAGTTAVPVSLPNTLRDPFTVLLVGVDKRGEEEDGVRSDTLIAVRVNPVDHWASMLSIPRDSVARIPGVGQEKINYAYTYGYENAELLYGRGTNPNIAGGAFAAEVVEGFLGIDVDYIAQVDFYGFERIVDTLGGIMVDVEQPLLDAEYPTENFGFERIYIPAGLQVFDGQTALRYARSRHSGTDFDRSRRQQQVLRALLREGQRRGILEQFELLPRVLEDIEESIATTLPINDLSVLHGMAQLAQHINPENIVQLSINPYEIGVINEIGSDIYWDKDDIAVLVGKWYLGPTKEPEIARVQVQNGAGVQGLATRVTNLLSVQGFTMAIAGDAPSIYEHTIIIDYTDCPETRERLSETLDLDSQHVYQDEAPDNMQIMLPPNTDIVVVLGEDYERIVEEL